MMNLRWIDSELGGDEVEEGGVMRTRLGTPKNNNKIWGINVDPTRSPSSREVGEGEQMRGWRWWWLLGLKEDLSSP